MHWEYEPHTFVLARNQQGHPTRAFAPDFWLPAHDRYIEVTTLDQRLVTRKNQKMRALRSQRPDIDIMLIYQRDYLQLLVKYGLEPPEQYGTEPLDAVRPSAADPLALFALERPAPGSSVA